MTLKIVSTHEFERKIQMGIPINHKGSTPPDLREHYGKTFSCGCGGSHSFHPAETPVFVDLLMFKVCVISNGCHFLNALKLRGLFGNEIKTLYCCKLEIDKENFGFKGTHRKFDEVIKEVEL